jgi:hypothetical protein
MIDTRWQCLGKGAGKSLAKIMGRLGFVSDSLLWRRRQLLVEPERPHGQLNACPVSDAGACPYAGNPTPRHLLRSRSASAIQDQAQDPNRFRLEEGPGYARLRRTRRELLQLDRASGRDLRGPRRDDPQSVGCNNLAMGKASDTGRYGPTWYWNGQPCRPAGEGDNDPGCRNHETNQFFIYAFGPGTYLACGANGICDGFVVQ